MLRMKPISSPTIARLINDGRYQLRYYNTEGALEEFTKALDEYSKQNLAMLTADDYANMMFCYYHYLGSAVELQFSKAKMSSQQVLDNIVKIHEQTTETIRRDEDYIINRAMCFVALSKTSQDAAWIRQMHKMAIVAATEIKFETDTYYRSMLEIHKEIAYYLKRHGFITEVLPAFQQAVDNFKQIKIPLERDASAMYDIHRESKSIREKLAKMRKHAAFFDRGPVNYTYEPSLQETVSQLKERVQADEREIANLRQQVEALRQPPVMQNQSGLSMVSEVTTQTKRGHEEENPPANRPCR